MSQREAELKRLATEGASNLYRRLELAVSLLDDPDWLAQHSGSLDESESYLADMYFREFRGLIIFGKLVTLYRKFSKEVWSEYRFDIAAIESLYDESEAKDRGRAGRHAKSYKAEVERLQKECESAALKFAELHRSWIQAVEEIGCLRGRVMILEREKSELRLRLEESEWQSKRDLVAAK